MKEGYIRKDNGKLKKVEIPNTKRYKAKGWVLGNLWGGGEGAYPTEVVEANTREELIAEASKMLNDGTLDSGMGFDGLVGAVMEVEEIETITVKGKNYTNSEYDTEIIGTLTDDQEQLCLECMYNI